MATQILAGGPILTMDAAGSQVEAVALSGNMILAAGRRAEVEALATEQTERIDLRGRTLLPGLIDPHGHFPLSGTFALHRVDLSAPPIGDCRRLADVFERIADRASKTPKGQWVLGVCLDDTTLEERRFPTREELDAISKEHPIFLNHMCAHSGVANSAALALAGIDRDTPQPQGGHIQMDPVTGEPNGILEEPAAMGICGRESFSVRAEQFEECLAWSADEYASHGVTTAQNAMCDEHLLSVFTSAAIMGKPKIRVVGLPVASLEPRILDGEIDITVPDRRRMHFGPRKLFSDGSIQISTAYLSQPYHTPFRGDAGHRGYPVYPRDELVEHICRLHEADHQIHIHANGDAAADDVLHAFREAQERCPREDHRHTIIHGQTLRSDQLDLMAELGVSVSFFSYHVYVWGDRHRDLFLGPERAGRINPAAEALSKGIRFTIHNDTPVTPMRPLPLVWCAVNRLTSSGKVLGADQRIDVMQALRCHTIDAAWQVGLENEIGSIEPGKRADLTLLDKNPLDHPETIKDISVAATICDGRLVHGKL
ncbi:MAG: amidohydrolase [Geminicoccaceae bacterium]